jgi:O-antigen ligase
MLSALSRQLRDRQAISHLTVLLAFFLPLSTSALNIIGLLLLLLWLAEGDFANKYRQLLANPVALVIIAYLLLYPLALLWTENLDNGLELLQKQWKYLLLPVLFTSVRRERMRQYLGAFLAAMTLSAIASGLLWLGLYQGRHGSPADPTPFLDRIDYTPFLALSAYLLAEAAAHRLRGRRRLLASGLALLMAFATFLTQGRSGQIVFLVLLVVWVFQFFPGRFLRAGLVSSLSLLLVLPGAYQFSSNFRARIDQTVVDFHDFERKPETSLGQRLIFLRNSWEVFTSHPWLGSAPGDFTDDYGQVNQRRSPAFPSTTNPHNQYLLVLTNFGLAGLVIFAQIFWRMARFKPREPDGLSRLRVGFLVFYLTAMACGSYLTHVHAGFLFILGSALLFRNQPTPADPAEK